MKYSDEELAVLETKMKAERNRNGRYINDFFSNFCPCKAGVNHRIFDDDITVELRVPAPARESLRCYGVTIHYFKDHTGTWQYEVLTSSCSTSTNDIEDGDLTAARQELSVVLWRKRADVMNFLNSLDFTDQLIYDKAIYETKKDIWLEKQQKEEVLRKEIEKSIAVGYTFKCKNATVKISKITPARIYLECVDNVEQSRWRDNPDTSSKIRFQYVTYDVTRLITGYSSQDKFIKIAMRYIKDPSQVFDYSLMHGVKFTELDSTVISVEDDTE